MLGLASLCCIHPAAAAAPTIQELVNQFSATNYLNIVSNRLYTRQGMNRNMVNGAHHDLCRDAIYNELQGIGLNPYKDPFTYQSNNIWRTACNVIAVQPGVQNPNNEVYVIGSHYDSKNNPGADDNATGVAALLEMARIFSRYHFAKTIVYCAFDGEEDWDAAGAHRLGSLRFVNQHRTENIKGMISVDMIGWQAPGVSNNTAYIEGRNTMAEIRNDVKAAMTLYGGINGILRTSSGDWSDHVAFADAGFQACLLIEGYFSSNPNYHKPTDYVERPGYIDWNYAGRMSKTVIGYYATKLQPVDVTPGIRGIQCPATGAVTVQFTGLPGCRYAIECSTNLGGGAWDVIETNTASLLDGTFDVSHTNASGQLAFFRARFVSGYVGTPPVVPDIIVDNPAATVAGTWTTGTAATDKYGSDYRFASVGTGTAYVQFRPTILTNGTYQVFEWHSRGENRTTTAPIEIVYSGGTQTVTVNQQINGGTWVLLGNYYFTAGTSGYIRIKDNFSTGSVVIADAVKLVYVP